ncbi:uncharacterized protein MONBRDRAFT_8635 [Monosiga brevicollis MX1]|uniref:DEAD/DEAH-box helicase domain-containing protein n=1 Tax=Monosiga brevicollis TaxID=81824 RepID=A9V0M5_MONBE|nr:uncharacterized protein MONBRDRAFT_8635 [Monosiga brevicollis MX1]EDQ89043.1 predicted protein [Monosiga brevicollis MX1]|eukprot:XP_001746148.1 hypothetical protein [Monosiga brevicollis MX1]
MSVAWPRTLVLHHTPEPSLGALNVAHSQSQHAGRTARNVYGRTQLDHKFVSSEAQYGHQFVSEEWHKLMKLVDVEDQIQAEAVDGQTCVQQVVHKQVVIQSSRVRNVSTQVQATVGTQTDPEVEACLDAEDDIDDIIAGLDLDEAEAAGSSMPVAVPRAVEEAASTALQQEPSQHNDQTQQQEYEDQLWLAQCVRQAWKTTFRDWDQYRLAQAMTRHEAQDGWLLAVAPTGMGKTLCTLAHLQPRRVVVWVVPLRELARDLCRRFKQADIVSQWAKNDGRDMQVNVQVIVMTVDFLVGHGMSCSRDRLVAHHQPSNCPVMKGRCFRCHCRGHGSSNCQVTLGAGVCYRCWRPQKIGGDQVVECTGRACAQRNRETIRALVASVSRSQTLHGIMQRMESPAELLAVGGRDFDPSEMQALVGWLYGAEGRVGHPRVLKFVIEAKRQFAMLK